jgi:AraC-like DNA-binding protein
MENHLMAKGHGGRPKIPMITEDLGELAGKLPAKPIILDQVIYWMDIGATAEEIAGCFRVSVDTLDRRLKETTGLSFAELKEKACGAAKVKLRNNQFKMSENNATMAIWLGKQWLAQKDPDKGDTFLISQDTAATAMQKILDQTKSPINTKPNPCGLGKEGEGGSSPPIALEPTG